MILDDGDGPRTWGNIHVESDINKFEKDLNNLKEILNVVVDLVECSMNGNLPHVIIKFLRTFLQKKLSVSLIGTRYYSLETNFENKISKLR